MAIIPLRDLDTYYDVKGGSPRTPPGGIKLSDIQQYSPPQMTESGWWKSLASAFGGLVMGLLLAWWSAFSSKGVSQQQLEDYVDKHSPYLMDKAAIIQRQSAQDVELGRIAGRQERVIERVGTIEADQKTMAREIEGDKHDIKLVSDYLEQLKVKK